MPPQQNMKNEVFPFSSHVLLRSIIYLIHIENIHFAACRYHVQIFYK